MHHLIYIGNLEVIVPDFVILVQHQKEEKILETSATQALILINETRHDIIKKELMDMEWRLIKINNHSTNEIQNSQTTAGLWGSATE